MAQGNIAKPLDVLIAELEFLGEYLTELSNKSVQEGRKDEAEVAAGWAALPDEAIDRLCN